MEDNKLRFKIRQILLENESDGSSDFSYDPYSYSGGGGGSDYGSGPRATLLKAFWSPFADVGKALKLTAQDTLNALRLTFETLVRFSPENLKKARDGYNQRKNKIAQEWGPIMAANKKAIEGSDLGVVTFALAPNIFFGIQLAKFAGSAPMTVLDFFEKSGMLPNLPKSWQQKIDNSAFSSERAWEDFKKKSEKKDDSSGRRGEEGSSVAGLIKKFFIGESVTYRLKNLIFEDDKGGSDSSDATGSATERVKRFLEQTGIADEISGALDEIIDAKRDAALMIVNDTNEKIQRLKDLQNVQSVDDFISEATKLGVSADKLNKLKSAAAESDKSNKNKGDVKSEPTEPSKSPKEKSDKSAGDKTGENKDGAPPDKEILEKLKSSITSSVDSIKSTAIEAIKALLAEDLKGIPEEARGTPGGQKMRDAMKSIIDAANKAFKGA